jgi:2-oxoisovalerate dehydrogenase E2 component (dihydrolipoyl transacylase)
MGARSIRLPDVGEGVAETEIVEWSVKVGDRVEADQIVVTVMTDKANVEIPAPFAGTVLELGGAVGETLAVGSELIRIEVDGLPDLLLTTPPGSAVAPAPSPSRLSEPAPIVPSKDAAPEPQQPALRHADPRRSDERPLASPAVRRRAREAGIDLRLVAGSGPAGRITHEDLNAVVEGAPTPLAAQRRSARNMSVETVNIVGLRRVIAQRMADASRRIAHFSYIDEVDVTALEELRTTLNARASEVRPKLTLLPFLMLALVRALAEHPQMNAHFDDGENVIKRYGAIHLGVATQTPNGLTVPVVRHAETLSLYEMATEMGRVTQAAREGRGLRQEMSGSTITITSLGPLGGLATTPVINAPEVAIVGVNKIAIRPVWRDNAFIARKMMNLSSSFDHRVIDGWDAATFIQRVRALLETPATIFID